MDLDQNAALREQGWRVFRSSTRDRLIPQTGAGAHLQRIKIAEALPVPGVFEGVVAQTQAEREAIFDRRQRAVADVERLARDRPTGETIVFSSSVDNPTANPGPAGHIVDDVLLLGSSPFAGFVTEATWRDYAVGGSLSYLAIRTGSGGSLFLGGQTFSPLSENIDSTPDFTLVVGGDPTISSRRMRVPVLSGEQLFAIVRTDRLQAANTRSIQITLTFESVEGAPLGARALLSSIGANRLAVGAATREAFVVQRQLGIEQERTKRAIEVETLKLEIAKASAEGRRPASQPGFNPFQPLLLAPQAARQLASRAPTPPPPPRVIPPKPEPPEGTGKTFVSAWNPSFGSIGYLIPVPPRGGKVNVFDNMYTIWDISGRNVGQGPIEPIRSDGEIPPGARISSIRGGTVPTGL